MTAKLVILPLILAGFAAATPWNRGFQPMLGNGRIYGGSDAPDGEYPYQVSIQRRGSHACGGSIIGPEWVLTAAHCVHEFPASQCTIFVGSNNLSGDGTRYQVLEIRAHEEFVVEWSIKHDIAVLKVEPITFTNKVQPIALDSEEIGSGESCVITGWGEVKFQTPYPDKLQHLQTVTVDVCRQNTEAIGTQICTSTEDANGVCNGDSGNPLVREVNGDKKQIGIVSWGIGCATGLPDILTRVSLFIPWISDNCDNCV